MKNYICDECGYIYDPEDGDESSSVESGTAFASLPEGWTCPDCGAAKTVFSLLDEESFQDEEDEDYEDDDEQWDDDEEEEWEDDED